jgi:NDP-sugar pyrophosphorylase family protein
MKAMVLAAGLGTRMRPLTLLRAKPALPVLNRPLIHWTLLALARAGVDEVFVNLHHRGASIRRAVGDGSAFGLRVRYAHEPVILGTGGGPRRLRRRLGDEPVLLVNGDVLFDFDLRALLRAHRRSRAAATLALLPNPDPGRYSAVVLRRDGRIGSLAGLPRPVRGRPWLFTGVQVLDPALLERLPPGPSDSVRDLYAPLVGEGVAVRGWTTDGAWFDFGAPRSYRDSQASLPRAFQRRSPRIDPSARIAGGAAVRRSVVGRGCVIGAGAVVEGSVLWDGVRVGEGARVRGCILAQGARVKAGERLDDVVLVRGQRSSIDGQ